MKHSLQKKFGAPYQLCEDSDAAAELLSHVSRCGSSEALVL